MVDHISMLVFGSQTPWPSEEQAQVVRQYVSNDKRLGGFRKAIESLPEFWATLIQNQPRYRSISGDLATKTLSSWLQEGVLSCSSKQIPNVLMAPLTIIIHTGLYFQYLSTTSRSHCDTTSHIKDSGIQGLCTGLLSALALASSKSDEELVEKLSSSLRLAMVVGAIVDLDEEASAQQKMYVCLAVRCKQNPSPPGWCNDILGRYPDAYTSVAYDSNSLTITIPESEKNQFLQDFVQEGGSVREIELRGRFHTPCHETAASDLISLCEKRSDLQLGHADDLNVPVRKNYDGKTIVQGNLTTTAIESILLRVADWQSTLEAAIRYEESILAIGLSEVVPSSFSRRSGVEVIRLDGNSHFGITSVPYAYPDNAIAIVGMAAKYAGADSLDEFWNLIESGTSMVERLPESRWSTDTFQRRTSGRNFWGNFVHDADAFDHKYFKASSRAAAAMDPQQRLLLQAAVRAVSSSGFFNDPLPPSDVGCYVGVATTDYHDNIASHKPSAFSALGELRAFLCGRISHHFGWTGPSMTFDTACSASAVAIDAACKAIKSGTVSAALAGGVNVCTSPYLWENLMGANFLSPTGQTKPFDAKGDGYCRGEGVGLVFLKRLDAAKQDGDPILGVIAGSAVNQCMNETFITVPHGPSQLNLYRDVLGQSGLPKEAITFVEAHGTGTQAGDPVEISSIRAAIGSTDRNSTVHLGSVKGNVGHTEAASGVASLIKTVLMMDRGVIPKLASHNSLNPKIPALESHHMAIPTETSPWSEPFKAALVNNYGAAGSNGAMVVAQRPSRKAGRVLLKKLPILVSASSADSLELMKNTLQNRIQALQTESITDIAFNLLDKYLQFSEHSIAGTVTTANELSQLLSTPQSECKPSRKPVVLVFGGQTRDHVGLDPQMIDKVSLFRKHLYIAMAAIHDAGFELKLSDILQRSTVEDVTKLHCMFFAVQYASAKSWMDAGLKVDAVIGHSFGQLTALCISGKLSLKDTIKIVAGRATLIKSRWGSERGSMISLEASTETAYKIVDAVAHSGSGHRVEIACFNGPTSHVLVGTAASIDYVTKLLADNTEAFGSIRYRVLKVTHGFHSEFTEPLLPELEQIAGGVEFRPGTIPLETCSESSSWDKITPANIIEHTRTAVYFSAAIERLAKALGPCTWLEAGGDSSVTGMVRRVFDSKSRQNHSFHGIKLAGDGALDGLSDSTVELWKEGQKVQFWPFHKIQRKCFASINLPPYQFEKSKHWLEWKEAAAPAPIVAPATTTALQAPQLLTLTTQSESELVFKIDPTCDEYQTLVKGHAVLNTALCPADWYTDMAHRALTVVPSTHSVGAIRQFKNLAFHSPLGASAKGDIVLRLRRASSGNETWRFSFSTHGEAKNTEHCTGEILFTAGDDDFLRHELVRYENLVDVQRPLSLLTNTNATGLKGSLVYQLFGRVVNYADYYQAVRAVSTIGNEVAARITLPEQTELIKTKHLFSPIAIDNFVQVAGIKVNCLNGWSPNQVYICGRIGRIQESPAFDPQVQDTWTVYAQSRMINDKSYMNDIYVFEPQGKLAMFIQDVEFTRVAVSSLTRILTNANPGTEPAPQPQATVFQTKKVTELAPRLSAAHHPPPVLEVSAALDNVVDNQLRLRQVISKVTDISLAAIKPESSLDDLGIDSLMATDVFNAIEDEFKLKIPTNKYADLQDIRAIGEFLSHNTTSPKSDTINTSLIQSDSITQLPTPGLDSRSQTDSESGSPSRAETNAVAMPAPSEAYSKLNQMLQELLDITAAPSPEMALEDLGMDSLLAIELCATIEKEFKVKSEYINTHGSLNELYESVLKTSSITSITLDPPIPVSLPLISYKDVGEKSKRKPGDNMQTVCFKSVDGVSLMADIYLPDASQVSMTPRPIALMIHGGGHTMLSRKDIRPRQTQLLLENGFLPISVDYRLCPEVDIVSGGMTDVCDALEWCRNELPKLSLGSGVSIDATKIAVVGWSTGGTLALSLGFTTLKRGIAPPDATLAFYCPSNYEDPFWKNPNYPENSQDLVPDSYDLLEAVQDKPITGYNVDTRKRAVGGWCSMADPRSRIVLHMNWKGQALPVLLNGLPTKSQVAPEDQHKYLSLPQPDDDRVVSISACSQIRMGNYKTPTFLIHSDEDDLVPLRQAQDTYKALKGQGIKTGMSVVNGVPHLFDLYRDREDKRGWKAVSEGYQFLVSTIYGS